MKYLTTDGLLRFYSGLKTIFAGISHTHNYAGSKSAGGAADSALNCTGNSATATKATQDSAGQQINTTYLKGLSVSGKTVTYTKGDGTTGTITTQDTVYSHPNSGVTAGTYKSVTVNAQGHITGGTNPTTLAGYGITDAPTTSAMTAAIASAVAGAGHLKRTIVSSLPAVASADADTIYMLAKTTSEAGYDADSNVYSEYMAIGGKWEKIGDTSVDLSEYAKASDFVTITNDKIDTILAG